MAKHKSMRQKARERAQERESTGGAQYLDLPDDFDFFKVKKALKKTHPGHLTNNVDTHGKDDESEHH